MKEIIAEMSGNIGLFWLYDWTIFFVLLGLLLLVVAIYAYLYFSGRDNQEIDTMPVEEDLYDPFDITLWWGRWQYLYNHADELKQGVFMQMVYRLFLDVLANKYDLEGQLAHANEQQLNAFSFTDTEKKLLHQLYRPVFQQGTWSLTKRREVLDEIATIVESRGAFYSLKNE